MRQRIRCYGSDMVLIQSGQAYAIRAFLQDTRSRNEENLRRDFSLLGEQFRGRFVYIGPVEPAAKEGDTLTFQGRIFEFRRAEPVYVGNEAAYCWGICVEKGGDSTWGS